MMYYYNDFAPYHMFGFGSIFMVLFWGLCLWAIFAFFRHGKCVGGNCSHGHSVESKNGNAIEILKERYAKGEISKEEFVAMKKDVK
ncbi:TPA: SHOCT domain-containing protein [Candidatus Nomurabacteria bacterium]|nr:SHOCT domain-containing protein [Candidatus Nomurabacteria bacterium]